MTTRGAGDLRSAGSSSRREREVAEVVRGEMALGTLLGHGVLDHGDARVVDQDVDGLFLADFHGRPADRPEIQQIDLPHLHVGARICAAQRGGHLVSPGRVTNSEQYPRAARRKLTRGHQTETAGRTRHDEGAPLLVGHTVRGPPTAAAPARFRCGTRGHLLISHSWT